MRRFWGNPITFGVVLLAALGLVFYLLLGREAADILVEQTLHREQVITRAGAASINSFLVLAGRSLVLLAGNGPTQDSLREFVEQWRWTPILGSSLVDNTGIVKLTVNQDGSKTGVGRSVADRDYFSKAKDSSGSGVIIGEAVISRVGQSAGRFVVPLVVPLRDEKGEFRGLVITSAVLDKLTELYLNPLKLSDRAGVHLVTGDGTVLYSTSGTAVGDNMVEYVREHKFLGSEVLLQKVGQELKKGEEGKLDLAWPVGNKWQRHLVAYSPIKIEEGRYWYLVLTTPVEDTFAFLGPLYMRILVTFAAVFLALLVYAVRLARHFASEERRRYEHKKHGIKE